MVPVRPAVAIPLTAEVPGTVAERTRGAGGTVARGFRIAVPARWETPNWKLG